MIKQFHRAASRLALIACIACIACCAMPAPLQSADASGAPLSGIWPRLIVDVQPHPEAAGWLRVRARLADGTVLEGIPEGCPDLAQVACSFSFFTAPRDKDVILIVEPRATGIAPVSARIPLGRFSYQGCRMTHVTVGFTASGQLQIGTPHRIDADHARCR